MKTYYNQLCGALGMLKTDGADLDWQALNAKMIDIGRRYGISQFGNPHGDNAPTGESDSVHDEIEEMHKRYRAMCISRGLIRPGYLFAEYDIVPLV